MVGQLTYLSAPITGDQFGSTDLDGFSAEPRDAHHGDERRLLLLLVAEPDEAVSLAEPRPVQHHCKAKVKPQLNLNLKDS